MKYKKISPSEAVKSGKEARIQSGNIVFGIAKIKQAMGRSFIDDTGKQWFGLDLWIEDNGEIRKEQANNEFRETEKRNK